MTLDRTRLETSMMLASDNDVCDEATTLVSSPTGGYPRVLSTPPGLVGNRECWSGFTRVRVRRRRVRVQCPSHTRGYALLVIPPPSDHLISPPLCPHVKWGVALTGNLGVQRSGGWAYLVRVSLSR